MSIIDEIGSNTRLRLLSELTQWHAFFSEDLESIHKELLRQVSRRKTTVVVELCLICFLQANIMNSFKEKYYVFDEDEKEVRRQLRLYLYTHLTIMTLFALLVPINIGKSITLSIYICITA